jgi:hypothetical protein
MDGNCIFGGAVVFFAVLLYALMFGNNRGTKRYGCSAHQPKRAPPPIRYAETLDYPQMPRSIEKIKRAAWPAEKLTQLRLQA